MPYAVRCKGTFFDVWYSEKDPEYTWTPSKGNARWFATFEEAQGRAIIIATKRPGEIGNIYIVKEDGRALTLEGTPEEPEEAPAQEEVKDADFRVLEDAPGKDQAGDRREESDGDASRPERPSRLRGDGGSKTHPKRPAGRGDQGRDSGGDGEDEGGDPFDKWVREGGP